MSREKSFSLKADLAGLNALMDELGNRAKAASRPAAQAAAQVLYDEVRRNVAKIRRKTGNLHKSIYQVYSRRNSRKTQGVATYHVSWNQSKTKGAPHGHLVEYGHLQRYEYYKDDQGRIRPKVRPGMQGKPPPKSNGRNRAALDAYYVTLPTPKQVAARPFVRPAAAKFPQAMEAARQVLMEHLNKPIRQRRTKP